LLAITFISLSAGGVIPTNQPRFTVARVLAEGWLIVLKNVLILFRYEIILSLLTMSTHHILHSHPCVISRVHSLT